MKYVIGVMAVFSMVLLAAQSGFAQWRDVEAGFQYALVGGDVDSGYGVQTHVGYELTPAVTVRAGLDYFSGDVSADGFDTSFTRTGAELSVRLQQPYREISPYIGFGAGYYLNELDDDISVDDKLGRFLEGGVEMQLDRNWQGFAQLRLLQLKPDGPDFVEFDLGALLLGAGVSYKF